MSFLDAKGREKQKTKYKVFATHMGVSWLITLLSKRHKSISKYKY